MKALLAIVALAWWLFYWNGEQWVPFGSWDTRSLCEKNADSFRDQGIYAVCIEVRAW